MADLSDVPTVGDTLFPTANWSQMLSDLHARADTAEKEKYIADNFRGLAAVAIMAEFPGRDEILAEIQQTNHAILFHPRSKARPGVDHKLGSQPVTSFLNLMEATIAHHPAFSTDYLLDLNENIFAYAGGHSYVLLQPAFVSNGRARGLHGELVYVPSDRRDGAPWFTTAVIDLNARGDSDEVKAIIADLYKDYAAIPSAPPLPSSPFQLMHSNVPLDAKLGPGNVLTAEWVRNDNLMFANMMVRFSGNPNKVAYHTMGAVRIPITADQMRNAIIARQLIMKSYEDGYMPSLGSHVGINSCVHSAIGLVALGDSGLTIQERYKPLDKVLTALMRRADKFYWTERKELRPLDFINLDGSPTDTIPEVTREVLQRALDDIFSSTAILISNAVGRPSYANQYLGFDRVPTGAEALYKAVAETVLASLQNKLVGIGGAW